MGRNDGLFDQSEIETQLQNCQLKSRSYMRQEAWVPPSNSIRVQLFLLLGKLPEIVVFAATIFHRDAILS